MTLTNRLLPIARVTAAAFVLLAVSRDTVAQDRVPPPAQGQAGTVIELVTPREITQLIARSRGKPLVMVLWASWCNPAKPMPGIVKRVHDTTEVPFDYVFIAFEDTREAVRAAAPAFGLPSPWYTTSTTIPEFGALAALPTTFIFDEAGRQQVTIVGLPGSETRSWLFQTSYVLNGRDVGGVLDRKGEDLVAGLWERSAAGPAPAASGIQRIEHMLRVEASKAMPNLDSPSEATARIVNVDGWVTNPQLERRLPVKVTGLLRQNGTIAVETLSQNGPVESVRVTRPFYIKALPDQMIGTLPTPAAAPQARPPEAPKTTPTSAPAPSPKPVPTRPVKTKNVTPVYPPEAMKAKRQGTVVLELTITKEGRVASGRVVTPVGPDLDAAALTAARQWEYRPALLDGVAVEATVTEGVAFQLR